jgi:hypothetical protein
MFSDLLISSMRNKLQLTPKEAAFLAGWRESWQKAICSTAPANRPQAEAAISRLYRQIGEPVPVFLWMESPIAAADAIGGLAVKDKPEGLKRLKAQIGEPLASELQDRFGDKFGKQLTDWLRVRDMKVKVRRAWIPNNPRNDR